VRPTNSRSMNKSLRASLKPGLPPLKRTPAPDKSFRCLPAAGLPASHSSGRYGIADGIYQEARKSGTFKTALR